jgi:hypothetical protein
MTRRGSCPCGAVRFTIEGPVRHVIVCHCGACRAVNGGAPWAASAALRGDLVLGDPAALAWEQAAVSNHGASRGLCRTCRAYVLWDAPGRDTVSFAAALLEAGGDLRVAAHIWVRAEELDGLRRRGLPAYAEGMPGDVGISWQDTTPATG